MKKNLKTFPAFMSFLATASTSNLKEDGYVLEFSLENGDTFWCLERDFWTGSAGMKVGTTQEMEPLDRGVA